MLYLSVFLLAVFHSSAATSSADLIFSPYEETAGKLSDSTSLSLITQSAESSDGSVTRYYFVVLSMFLSFVLNFGVSFLVLMCR